MRFLLNTLLAALLVAGFGELSRRSSYAAALLISLPLTSILALTFLHVQTGDTARVAALSLSIFWLVLPGLVFFLVLPALLRQGLGYWPALGATCAFTAAIFFIYAKALAKFGVTL